MADTPEEVARELLDAGLCEHGERNEFLHAYECEVCLPKALREAEARGFAKGLEVAAAEASKWSEETLADKLRALAAQALVLKAPPEVAAAEPKP